MTDETTGEKPKRAPKPKPAKVELQHPKMKGRALVSERDVSAWLGKGWQSVKAGIAD